MSNEAEEQGKVPGDRKGSAHESVARYEKVVRIGKGTYGIVCELTTPLAFLKAYSGRNSSYSHGL